jgi:hypothetical protein
MTTKDSTLVRLPNDLVARLDELRGEMSRPAFLTALVMATEAMPSTRPTARAPRPAKPTSSTEPCRHPISRRIGNECAVCGKTVGW